MVRTLFLLAQSATRSPSRHPRMAVVLGRLLGAGFVICMLTGVYSHFIQHPLPFLYFPNRPIWLYRVTQGTHVLVGILCIPLLLAKLYTVFPLLFKWPPVNSVGSFLERASITVFVSSSLVQLFTGFFNSLQWYPFPFNFLQVHWALAWVIIGSLALHIGIKLPVITRWWRARASVDERGNYLPVAEGEGELGHERVPLKGFVTSRVQRYLDGD